MNEKKLIHEISRINNLMGNNLLVESVATRFVTILDNLVKNQNIIQLLSGDPIATSAFTRLRQIYTNWRSAATGQPIEMSTVIDDLYLISQRIPQVRISITDLILDADPTLARRFNNFLKSRKNLESVNRLPNDQMRNWAVDRIRAWYGQAANNLTQSHIDILADRLMFDVRRNINLPPSSTLDNVVSKIPFKNFKYLLTQLKNIFTRESALQRKFIDLSESANKKLLNKNPGGARKDVESMLAIFASSKKNRTEGFDEVYKQWKNDILLDPQSKMTNADFVKFDEYINTGRGQELFNELTKLDPSFYEQTVQPWLKLWPFKMPNTSGGFFIFSNKMTTKDWWERLWMFILTKNARTVKEYVGYLQRNGVKRGAIELLVWRFIMLRLFLPFMVTVGQIIPSTTEKLLNEFFESLEGWGINYQIDIADDVEQGAWERYKTNVINTLVGFWLEFTPSGYLDQQTYVNEAAEFARCLSLVFNKGGTATCLDNLFTFNQNAVREMDIPQEVIDVTIGEQPVPTDTTPSPSPSPAPGPPPGGPPGGPPGS
jgi:hypothetical protein